PPAAGLPNPGTYDTTISGVVTDQVSGLMWEASLTGHAPAPGCTADSAGVLSCPQRYAAAYCAASALGGRDDWRLPTVTELASLIDFTILSPPAPAIDSVAFPGTPPEPFWTSTRNGEHLDGAWSVTFNKGFNSTWLIDEPHRVRCVR